MGVVLSLVPNIRINEYGQIEVPYYKVVNGKITDGVEWLSPEDEKGCWVAFAGQVKDGKLKEKVQARRGYEELSEVKAKEVSFCGIFRDRPFSLTTKLVPFLSHNDPNRILIADAMIKQALPLKDPEPPLILSGVEKKLVGESNQLVYASKSKKVSYGNFPLEPLSCSTISKSLKGHIGLKKEAREGDLISDVPSTLNGELSLGKNLLVAYVPWKGYNFEDAVVISDEAAKLLTSRHNVNKYSYKISPLDKDRITRDNPFLLDREKESLDENGIIKRGSRVKSGDVLISRVAESEIFKRYKGMEAIFIDPFGEDSLGFEDNSLRAAEEFEGKVEGVEIKEENGIKTITPFFANEKETGIGDKLANRHGGKGVVSRIEKPFG